MFILLFSSKPALLEGLEIDQYVWSVIQSPQCSEADEVTIDSGANMRPVFIKTETGDSGGCSGESKPVLPISPNNIKLPSLSPWDIPTSKSPGLYAPPDMNSKCAPNTHGPLIISSCLLPNY